MKIKNIAIGNLVQVKKSMCHSEFKAKQVCEVIDIDPTDKYGFDVLIKGENCLDWVNHKDLKKPEPKLKQLDQSVFDGQPEEKRFFAIDEDGQGWFYRNRPSINAGDKRWMEPNYTPTRAGFDYDASNWRESLIERESKELTGSDYYHSGIASKLLERGHKLVVCFVSNVSEADALNEKRIEVITSVDTGFNDADDYGWQFVVPINSQGEPLTAADVGL